MSHPSPSFVLGEIFNVMRTSRQIYSSRPSIDDSGLIGMKCHVKGSVAYLIRKIDMVLEVNH